MVADVAYEKSASIEKSGGFLLIEWLVALTLTSGILLGLLACFVCVHRLLLIQKSMAEIQETGRLLAVLLSKSIQEAGAMGCNRWGSGLSLYFQHPKDRECYGMLRTHAVGAFSKESVPSDLDGLSSNKEFSRHSDALWILSLSYPRYRLQDLSREGTCFLLPSDPTPATRPWAITDCIQVAFLRAEGPETERKVCLPLRGDLRFDARSAVVGSFAFQIFYIVERGKKKAKGQPLFSLAMKKQGGKRIEYVAGVSKLQVRFGCWEEGTMVYYPSEKVRAWEQVVSVRIKATLCSQKTMGQGNSFFMDKKMTLTADGRLQMEWVYEWPYVP